MRYVSKVTQYGSECYACTGFNSIIVEISKEKSLDKEVLDFTVLNSRDIQSDDFRNQYADVFGLVIDKHGWVMAWKVTKFDLGLYNFIDFVRVVRNPDAVKPSWKASEENRFIDWLGPTNALKKSAYTLFYTDTRLVSVYENRNHHTLGAVLRRYFENDLKGEYLTVKIEGDLIEVKLYQSTYYYRICDLKNFNRAYTKCVVLGS